MRIIAIETKRRFGGRRQWKFALLAGNNEPIDPRDTYANVGDIRDIWTKIVASDELVDLEIRYRSGIVKIEHLR